MIAMIIFTAGIIAVVQAFNAGFLSSEDASNVDLALNIAQAKMEEIKNSSFSSIADSGPAADATFSNFNLTVNAAEGQNPMRVDVTVNWNVKGGQANVALTSLVANY
jgi:Tfp pilus assembly protein PilV